VGGLRCFLASYIALKPIITPVSSEKPGTTRRVSYSSVAQARLLSAVSGKPGVLSRQGKMGKTVWFDA
jgi:hypothetical protein